jgi:hypothetical protein
MLMTVFLFFLALPSEAKLSNLPVRLLYELVWPHVACQLNAGNLSSGVNKLQLAGLISQ